MSADEHLARAKELQGRGDQSGARAEFRAAHDVTPSRAALRGVGETSDALADVVSAYKAYAALLALSSSDSGWFDSPERGPLEEKVAQLAERVGHLRVDVSDPGATIRIDGVQLSPGEADGSFLVERGLRIVDVTKDGFEPSRREVVIGAAPAILVLALVPEVRQGIVRVTAVAPEDSTPADAADVTLVINGTAVGPLPFEGRLAPGHYVLKAEGRLLTSEELPIEIVHKTTIDRPLTLAWKPGRLMVTAASPSDDIYVDGVSVGQGTWAGPVARGLHEVSIRREGHHPFDGRVSVLSEEARFSTPALTPLDAESSVHDGSWSPGVYGQVYLLGAYGITSTNEFATECRAEQSGGSCDTGHPWGAGLGLRFGVALEQWLGIELSGFGLGDVTAATVSYPQGSNLPGDSGVARDEEYLFIRYGGALALGVRASSPGDSVRVTGSFGLGASFRNALYARTVTQREDPNSNLPVSDALVDKSDTVNYVSPLVAADLGIVIGKPIGTKLFVSLLLLLEQTREPTIAPGFDAEFGATSSGRGRLETPATTLVQGTQIFLGPAIGLQFGR